MHRGSGPPNADGMSGEESGDFVPPPVDIDRPRWDQRQFVGRLQHFARTTNPLLLLKWRELDGAARLVSMAREGRVPRGTTAEQLYSAKVLYDSAFHPDTGEKMNAIGRMSAQLPACVVLNGILLTFYRTTFQVFAAQWLNQSFGALVNYTNRNAKSQVTNKQLAGAYVSATAGAVGVSVWVNSLITRAPPLMHRLVPLIAIATANCINIPFMRQRELVEGVVVTDEHGNALGKSQRAAAKGISQVCFCRVCMGASSMILGPLVMNRLERNPLFKRGLVFSATVQALLSGIVYIFAVPIGCALFPQTSSMQTTRLEKSLQREIHARGGHAPSRVYFNKGL